MLITLHKSAELAHVRSELVALGLWVEVLYGEAGIVHLRVLPHSRQVAAETVLGVNGVADVACARSPHPLLDEQDASLRIAGVEFGEAPVLIAGPCAVESPEQIAKVAARVARAGGSFLRGGAFKPRSSPYSFQGHGAEALAWMREAADEHGLRVVTEAPSVESVAAVAEAAELIQIGSRNMHNQALLAAAGSAGRPVLLKRGMAATVEEWLAAAEACLLHGAPSVILCERGVRGFDPRTRNLLDVGAIALLSEVYGLPVIADPSHGCGRRDLVGPLAGAALAAGAAGLILETHDAAGEALSDGPQALSPVELEELAGRLGFVARGIGPRAALSG